MMKQEKLCCIFRRPALYREPIHRLMDKEFDIDWYFGDKKEDIKCYDVSIHEHCTILAVKELVGSLYYAKGETRLLFKKEYNTFLMLNSTHNVSVWLFAFCKRLFFKRKKKLYYWCHGWYGKENGMERLIKKFLFSAADGIFTYGEYARDLMIKEGIDGNKIFPIHNSLNYESQLELRDSGLKTNIFVDHFGNEFPVLIFIGRLTPVKELDKIILAMAILLKRGYDFNLVLVGDGMEKKKLESLTNENCLSNRVWFYGACYDEKTNAELIYNADLCVAPGNIGLTAMHCLVFGTPAITHNNFEWQMPEFEAIKESVTGAFFERGNAEALADAIHLWFASHQDREQTRRACYEEIDAKWTPEFQIEVLKNHIELK